VSEDHGVTGGAAPASTPDTGAGTAGGASAEKIRIEGFGFSYQDGSIALDNINLSVIRNEILGIMGPSQSGKSTLLRSLNRMVDAIPGTARKGSITLEGVDIFSGGIDPDDLRRRVGMVFDVPVPLPRSIYENVAYGPKLHGIRGRKKLDELVEFGLRSAILWDEVKDRLGTSALRLSGGQQQRLCIARTLALDPEVILLDEPCSGLDPISTLKVEEAMSDLKSKYTIVLVTNNTKQAARVSDKTAYFLMGELVEYGRTKQIFTVPRDRRTDDYISGRFG
jgi:phosphate transport system ATP-binding protein